MIKFNELRITPNNESLIIDVSIEDADYYKNVVLDSIIIDTQDTYVENGPSSKAVFKYTVAEENYDLVYSTPENCGCAPVQDELSKDYCFTIDDYSKKRVKLILKPEDLGVPIAGNMFFVYAISSGEPLSDTPCELRNSRIIGTAINLYPIYKQSMLYTRELGDTCSIPKNFVDYILKIKALDLSLKTGNYQEAIRYWNRLFKNLYYTNNVEFSNCGCYGKGN